MTPYSPDLGSLSVYEKGKMDILMVHVSPSDHDEPYYSKQKPVEVKLE